MADRGKDDARFQVLDHACRLCGGRLLRDAEGVMCADCDLRGAEPVDICWCGEQLRTGRRPYRCAVAPAHVPGGGPRIYPGAAREQPKPRKR